MEVFSFYLALLRLMGGGRNYRFFIDKLIPDTHSKLFVKDKSQNGKMGYVKWYLFLLAVQNF
jgi:hypothetical protein